MTFSDFFLALWGFKPFPWQYMLTERLAAGRWPRALDLPTAAGKTACIDAAVWSLAEQAERPLHERTAPRRVWFVVDRRIVVDEAHARAEAVAFALHQPEEYFAEREKNVPPERRLSSTDLADAVAILKEIADRLRRLSQTERPLAVGRLRGGILCDDTFARLPSQPAVITSTVDQLGSRLLFRSYGGSQRVAPIHAGLAAHDSLILLDEAHCSVPFMQTLQAIERFRQKGWAEQPVVTPFAYAILTATPPLEIEESERFPGTRRDAALDDLILRSRLAALKPAALCLTAQSTHDDKTDPLATEAVERATQWVRADGKQRVAVIVNRVHTAGAIAAALRAKLSAGEAPEADVVLLTGRLRPLERDALTDDWKPFLRASGPVVPLRPIVLVSTQAIEVGADFSFDALATECASLDALRQRFGRLNRMGLPGAAPAAVLVRESQLKESDPIYGDALRATWELLGEIAQREGEGNVVRRAVDFGFNALRVQLNELDSEKFIACLAPHPNAPVLLPAHLDLLCQTSPIPHPEPDIALFLHGKDRGAPEVRVLWRGDLSPDATEWWLEIVALCPPQTTESVAVPLHRLRRWLVDEAGVDLDGLDMDGDVEGGGQPDLEEESGGNRIRPCIAWRGRDRSRLIRAASDLWPGDVIVLPSAYGLAGLAQTLPEGAEKIGFGKAKTDLWEWALEAADKPSALRLHRALWDPWLDRPLVGELLDCAEEPFADADRLHDLIHALANYVPMEEGDAPALPKPLRRWLKTVPARSRIEEHPAGGVILFVRKKRIARESDLFADDDDLTSASGDEVSLKRHTASVVSAARKMAAARSLPAEFADVVELSALWHDAGKLDERFQRLLGHGNEISDEPLAKSCDLPLSPTRRRAIREAAGLPDEFRHEMLSALLAERLAPLSPNLASNALALHLIASHHGYARPFPPVSPDLAPPALLGAVNGAALRVSAAERANFPPPHRLDSGFAERFWELTRRYGWWGLAYLEAHLRLADWYGSEHLTPNVANPELAENL
jgi:CRISPR-associated endonuclease/helicase Cas3